MRFSKVMGANLLTSLTLLTSVAVLTFQSSHCKIITETIELAEGTTSFLNCSTIVNGVKVDVYWEIPGITEDGDPYGPEDVILIYNADCNKHSRNYTCFRRAVTSKVVVLKIFVVKVIANSNLTTPKHCCEKDADDDDMCGSPGQGLFQEKEMCVAPTVDKSPCCDNRISPPGMLHVSKKLSDQVENKCVVENPWQIDVKWNLTKNATWIWGWQVSLKGLRGNAGYEQCVQINSKDKLLNWTFDRLIFGSEYYITVQALPSDSKNYIVKTIALPKKTDICNEFGQKCHWEICFPLESVQIQQEKNTSVLTWHLSKHHKTVKEFEFVYKSSDDASCTDSGKRYVNTTRVVLDINICAPYYVEVRPVFSNGETGKSSKPILFPPQQVHGVNQTEKEKNSTGKEKVDETPIAKGSYTDVIISCSIAVGLLIFGVLAVVFVKRKRKHTSTPLLPEERWRQCMNNSVGVIANPAPIHKTKVFIVHDNHCRLCKNVTHALANVLDKTGYIQCIVDFSCSNGIAERGMRWYEDMIKECDKIIVVCTKDGKRMRDENEKATGPYTFTLNMLLGQIVHHENRSLQVFPVYFDISSPDDVPLFLSEHRCYALPSNVQDLCSALYSSDNFHHDSGESSCGVSQQISDLQRTIDIMAQNHKGYGECKHKKTTSL